MPNNTNEGFATHEEMHKKIEILELLVQQMNTQQPKPIISRDGDTIGNVNNFKKAWESCMVASKYKDIRTINRNY